MVAVPKVGYGAPYRVCRDIGGREDIIIIIHDKSLKSQLQIIIICERVKFYFFQKIITKRHFSIQFVGMEERENTT